MTLEERRHYLASRMAQAKARLYDLKLQIEAEETNLLTLSGAMETIADLEAQAKAEAEAQAETASA